MAREVDGPATALGADGPSTAPAPAPGPGEWLRRRPWIWVVLGIVVFILADLCFVAWAQWTMQEIVR